MEIATQTLHRLTSYQPGRDWDEAIDDPRIVQDLEARYPNAPAGPPGIPTRVRRVTPAP